MVSIMKIEDDAALNTYLVKHLQPLTEADPNILAKYVWALLKNNKPKTELQAFCTEKLVDFLGEDSKTFVVNLFHALEDGTIATRQEETDARVEDESGSMPATSMSRVASTGDNIELKASSQSQKQSDANNLGSIDHEEEGSDDEDDDRNHKHRRRAERSRSLDRDSQDGPLRKRNRSNDTNSIEEFHRGPSYLERDGLPKRRLGPGAATRLGMDANQRGLSRGASMLRNDGLGSRFEHQNGLSRGFMGRGRGGSPSPLGSREQRAAPVDATDPNALMLPPGLAKNLFAGRSGSSRPNPSHSPWLGYNRFTGMTNGTLDHALPLNTGMQGSRGVSISPAVGVGINIGMGMALRPRCPDFEERGYCLRGDLCPMEHGANRIVVEDVQSLSKYNLPVALPSGRGMALGNVSVSSSSLAPFSGVSNIVTRDVNMSALLDSSFSKVASGSNVSTEPDLYDPDQPLWNKEQPASLVDGFRKLPPFRKDSESESSALERSQRQSPEDEAYGKSSSGSMGPGQSVWNRISRVDQGDNKDGSIPMFADPPVESSQIPKVPKREAQGPLNSPGKWKIDPDERYLRTLKGALVKSGGNGTPEREIGLQLHAGYNPHGGRSLRIPSERAHNTLYVGCLPSNPNRKELLMAHFQKFGDIVDVRVPANGDRAFVQFLRHEDAEAALNSPEAVMGNRFIRLSWAKRDSVPVFSMEGTMVLPSMAQGKESGLGDIQGLARDASVSMVKGKKQVDAVPTIFETNKNKQAAKSGTFSQSNPNQKKQEELELMKEAIRKKQEVLAQKREEFRRKLEWLSKQGNGTTSELEVDLLGGAKGTASDQATNKEVLPEKEGADNKGVHKPTSLAPSPAEKAPPSAEKALSTSDQAAPGLIKDLSKQPLGLGQVSSGILSQPSPSGLRGHSLWPSPGIAGSQWAPLRYKIDNRTTVFQVLAPIPDSLLDAATLKHHFQFFGEVVSVEIEDLDRQGEPHFTEQATAKVTFSTRNAAEKAYAQGRWFQGTSLQFSWVNPPPSTPGVKSSDNLHVEVKDSPRGSKNQKGFEDRPASWTGTSAAGDGFDIEGGGETNGELKNESVSSLATGMEKVTEEGNIMGPNTDG